MSNPFRAVPVFSAILASVLMLLPPCGAIAADRVAKFGALTPDDIALLTPVLTEEPNLKGALLREYIRIPDDFRIAKVDLNDDGQNEILLLIKTSDQKSCLEQPCRLQVWHHKAEAGAWEKIGNYEMKEENLRIYDETHNGYHEIGNSLGIITWYDQQQ